MPKLVSPAVALSAALVATLVVGACSSSTTADTPPTPATSAPLATAPVLPAGWQTVSDGRFGFRVSHPKSWKVIPADAPSVAGNPAYLTGFGAPAEPGSPFKANVSILGQVIPPAGADLTLENVAEQAQQVIASTYPGLVAGAPVTTSLGGVPAIQIEYQGVEHGVDLTITQLMALHDDSLVLLTTSAQTKELAELGDTFDTIVTSFRFTN